MSDNRKEEKKDSARNSDTKLSRKWLIISVIVIGAIAITAFAAAYSVLLTNPTQAQAQDASLGQILNSISPINVQATVVKDRLSSVDGVSLTEVAKSTTSETTESVGGTIKSVFIDGQAEVAILKGVPNPATGDNTIAFRITNTGKDSFKIVSLGMEGQTKSGYIPMQVLAVSEKNFETPQVNIRDAVLLNPGESMTGYIIGKWKAVEISEDITEFRAGAVYRYETGDSVKVWSITTDLYNLS